MLRELGERQSDGSIKGTIGKLKEFGLTKKDSHHAQQIFEHQDLIPAVVAKAIEAARA